jgi:hypothetical protein
MVTPVATSGQATGPTITFTMPLKLTNVPSDIARISIFCHIQSVAILTSEQRASAQVEFLVRDGQVITETYELVTSATVQIRPANLDPNALGKQATYQCSLNGFSRSLQRWDVFNETHTEPAFRLSPTPVPLTGSFVW